MLMKIVYFKACFGEIRTKVAILYETLTLNLVFEQNFDENSAFIWPFITFSIWSFLF